jgi:hypothetical protein
MQKLTPPKWWEVYPQGTARGSEEAKLFRSLCRNPNYVWRSAKALADNTGLSKTRVEEILLHYFQLGVVLQKEDNPELWGYWENVKPELRRATHQTIGEKDKEQRLVTGKAQKATKP